ncbi:MAG: TonB-dependent receptor plug domain-containing protein [Chitinophagaceae bacterium]|nr:TonB-dependent receptor plug domain-containing protein [Chitinophagaceae bacterium]
MITQSQKTSHRYLRKVLALPLALLVLGLVAFQVKQEVTEIQLKEDVVINNMNDAAVDEQTISIIDTVPAKANSRLKLKGVATPGKEPLYVIDGITVGEKNKALLDTLNPDRIESISVIKNAEATALYGKDAENGVIIISTKKSADAEQEVVLVGRPKYETRLSEVKLSPVETNEEVVVEGRPSTVKEVVVQGYKKPKENANIQVDEVIVEGHKIEKAEGKEVVVQGIKSTKTAPKEEVREVTVQGYQSKRVTVSDVPSEMNEVVVVGYSKNDTKTEPLFEAVEEAAQPQGGKDGWVKYLQRNLNANIAVENNAPIGKYTVQVRFIVEKDGSINKITPITLHGYGMEEEAVRVIKASGTWIPAKQNGREVRSYRQQPITFVVEKESKPVALKLSPAEVADEIKSSGTLYPNPADGTFTISLRSEKNTDATVQVLTMNGASTGILKKVNLIKGNNSISMPTGSLKTGTYIVNIAVENNKPEVYKLIKN